MEKEIKTVEPGIRLDRFLANRFPDASRAYWKDMISRGLVKISGAIRSADYRLMRGDVIAIERPDCAWKDLPLEDWIVSEDKSILVLNKPSGLLVHPVGGSWLSRPEAAATEQEANLAGLLFQQRPQIIASGASRCGIVHRLDRGTSGLMIVAKTPAAQEALVAAFEAHEVGKTYRAIVLGKVERRFEIEAPVGRKAGGRRITVSPWGKEASTQVKVVETAKEASLVEARPLTGRTHQIRAHLAHIGHPVLGDPEARTADGKHLEKAGIPIPPRLMLHAYKLEFDHPKTHDRVKFVAAAPKDFRQYWQSIP